MRVHSPAPHAHGVRSLHRLVYRSLAFLHKKTWHTANLKNVEKVWAAEEEQKKEEQKLERWKKEREEERQQAELRALQDEMSKTKRETRVDFLYEQPQTNAQSSTPPRPVPGGPAPPSFCPGPEGRVLGREKFASKHPSSPNMFTYLDQ